MRVGCHKNKLQTARTVAAQVELQMLAFDLDSP